MNNAPIAVFDSGQGGLSVWSELYRGLPHESLLYYGDGKNCPYGNQSKEQVTEYVDYAVRRMLEAGAKMIVIACNTATAAAIDYLRTTAQTSRRVSASSSPSPARRSPTRRS